MRDLTFNFKQILDKNRDGSYATQNNRMSILTQISDQLWSAGYHHLVSADQLKGRHIDTLVSVWKSEKLSIGTIKNRMAALRYITKKVGRESVVRSNERLGIETRTFTATTDKNKAHELDDRKLNSIRDPLVKMSLQLQSQFGLRREEAIKFKAGLADHGNKIVLKSSWTKGGKAREIPIRTSAQRELINAIKAARSNASLIPADMKYVDQMRRYERETARVGLSKNHGLRHEYAQTRYKELTGRAAPAAGGKSSKELNSDEKTQDRLARLAISRELGHEREQITAVYLGR